ncbi:MAG TPA: metalloregulator ArsR/SmtB family transcription factor [Gaiella sp.]
MGDRIGAVFVALADPSRRTIVERLAHAGRATPTELAGELPMTRQAVAKHLATLEHAGLVRARREGRQTVYRPDPAPLRDATAWMDRVGAEWDARLEALARHVDSRREP